MVSSPRSFKRTLCVAGGFALAGALLAGCGGGGTSSSTMPQTVPQKPVASGPGTSTKVLKHVTVTRATIPAVMSKLVRASAFYSPRRGSRLRLIQPSRRPLTSSAGMDLSYYGGPVQTGANEYDILVNCNDESCWGGLISQFQNDLFGSNMMSILSQYNASGSYAFGGDIPTSYQISGTLQDQDIFNILYSVITANNLSTGYGSEFHVFLGQGVDECSSAAGGCYSPDNPSQWAFCAYHGSNDWSDIGHVLYSVEPYQGVNGCEVSNQPSPNGVVADSTASTLSHETFETITDSDVGANNLAWYNQQGGEIGDLCAPAAGVPTGNVQLQADTWEIQMEYDNNIHDCSYTL